MPKPGNDPMLAQRCLGVVRDLYEACPDDVMSAALLDLETLLGDLLNDVAARLYHASSQVQRYKMLAATMEMELRRRGWPEPADEPGADEDRADLRGAFSRRDLDFLDGLASS